MKLKSFGCSFIFGNELTDEKNPTGVSQLTWPAHLAKDLGYQYQCYAQPGCGNLYILNQIISQAALQEPAIFVINWTWLPRFDYIDINIEPETWNTFVPADTSKRGKLYYTVFQSQTRDKLTTLIYVKTAIDLLTQKGYKFIMTYMDELMFENIWHTNSAIADLQTYVKPHMTTFDGTNFLDWSRTHGYPVSKYWHPLDQAHVAAFEYIKSLGKL